MKQHVVPGIALFFLLVQAYGVASDFVAYQFGYAGGELVSIPRHTLPPWLSPGWAAVLLAYGPLLVLTAIVWAVARRRMYDDLEAGWLAARIAARIAVWPSLLITAALWWYSWEATNPFRPRG